MFLTRLLLAFVFFCLLLPVLVLAVDSISPRSEFTEAAEAVEAIGKVRRIQQEGNRSAIFAIEAFSRSYSLHFKRNLNLAPPHLGVTFR